MVPRILLAREKMADASTIAGMAFANAFLGVCHSMAHKLGAFFNLPHGVANALMINETIKFNAAEAPVKMGTFPQYDHPHTLERYAEIADYLGIKGRNTRRSLTTLLEQSTNSKQMSSRGPSGTTVLMKMNSSSGLTKWQSRHSTISARVQIPAIR